MTWLRYLPLYSGPQIKVQIGSPDHEYAVSKGILCKHSRYFARMFDGPLVEGTDNIVRLNELAGVVSVRSFTLLIQWCYTGKIVFKSVTPSEKLEALVEFARIANFCDLDGMG